MTRVFVTGATGYIGGQATAEIARAHPDWEIVVLARNQAKAEILTKAFPNVRVVEGSLESKDVIEKEAEQADIALNCANADSKPALEALIAGLSATSRSAPGTLIHTSGTGVLLYDDIQQLPDQPLGSKLSSKIYDDGPNRDMVLSLPPAALHKPTENMALGASQRGIKTAVVAPPTIYGETDVPGSAACSMQVPWLAKLTLQRGGVAPRVNAGLTYWNHVHVRDLGRLYALLADDALSDAPKLGADWTSGRNYFFAEAGEHVWGEVAAAVAAKAHELGFTPRADVEALSAEAVDALQPHGSWLWGANSRGRAVRAREALGWAPREVGLAGSFEETVRKEAAKLGIEAKA